MAVEFVIDLLANDWTESEIIQNYPRLTHEDIQACFSFPSSSQALHSSLTHGSPHSWHFPNSI